MTHKGFSLLECLVALTIGSMLVILVSRATSMILLKSNTEIRNLYAQISLASLLDRIAADINRSHHVSQGADGVITCQSATQSIVWRLNNNSCTRTVSTYDTHHHKKVSQSIYLPETIELIRLKTTGVRHAIYLTTASNHTTKRVIRVARSGYITGEL